jgi:hypothetical protein
MSNDNASSAGKNRVPKGISTGGQFAATAHAEPTLSLAAGRLEEFTDAEEFVNIAYSSAKHWQRRYNQQDKSIVVDEDDIAQETMLRTLEALHRGNKITDFKQFVNSTGANVTVRATETVFRAEDRKAYRVYEDQRAVIENEIGRPMTPRERKALEQKVRDEWHDPRHKPSKDFMIARTFDRSLDAPHTADGGHGAETTIGSRLVNPEQSGHYIKPGSYMDRAHHAMDETGAAHKAEMKRLAWNALAEDTGIPMSNPGSLSQRQVTKHRGIMDNHKNRVLGACKAWSVGNDGEATEALFAPFGELGFEEQEKVVDALERFGPDRAQIMWESAMSIANNKHSKNV